MLRKIQTLKMAFIFCNLFFTAKIVLACSCGPTPTVLSEYESSKDIFIAKITSVEKAKSNGKKNLLDGIAGAKMIVEKIYKGNLKVGDELFFSQGGGADCIWTYNEESIGGEILIYSASFFKNTKNGIIVGCGRTNNIKFADDDLLYLNNLNKVRGKSRISGTLIYNQEAAIKGENSIYKRLAEKNVKIINKSTGQTYEVTTNENGVYEIYDLPAGRYYIEPEMSKGWKIDNFMSEAFDYQYWEEQEKKAKANSKEIKEQVADESDKSRYYIDLFAHRHAGLNFDFRLDNKITGKVVNPVGEPMEMVCFRVIPAKGEKAEYFSASGCTNKDGKFLIDDVPPGSYYLVANEDGKLSYAEPFKTLYYPGVFEKSKAKVVIIGEGETIENLQITVPKVEETITIEGKFLYSDGKPVVDEFVEFKPDVEQSGIDGKSNTKTDEQGRFKIKILKSQKGKLFGGMFSYVGKFEKCPILDKFIKNKTLKFDYFDLTTPKIEINAINNMKDVSLNFPFKGCKKAKVD